jgi:hypothetical protein
MLTDTLTTRVGRRRTPGGRLLLPGLLLGALLPLLTAQAVEVESLYTAEVRLDPARPDSREAAYENALQQILIRITGSEQAGLSPELNELFPNPGRYVLQYRPGEENTLWVALDGAAIAQVVRQTGYPVWGSDRPVTLLWLAVDWGRGERALITADDADEDLAQSRLPDRDRLLRDHLLRERVRDIAEQRGLPLVFPPPDTEDTQNITFTDVWGGFHDRLLEVSRHLGASAVLVGRLRPGVAERNRWSFYFGGQQRQWSGEPEEAMHMLADTLAGQLAVSGTAPREAVALTVSGVDSMIAYGEVQRVIDSLAAIERYAIETVAGDRIRYRIEISGGAASLGAALDFSGKLVRAETSSPMTAPGNRILGTLEYVYKP